jgi:hypothetical protein
MPQISVSARRPRIVAETSQADSAASIPVTRSSLKAQVRGLAARPGLASRGSSDTVRAISQRGPARRLDRPHRRLACTRSQGVGACENDGPERHGKWARCCRTRLQHRTDPDQRLGSVAHPYAQEVALSPRVVSASEWVPARRELRATEEEAVRALWQIADDTGR